MITIPVSELNSRQEQWLSKNVGPRMFYLHNKQGGQGWVAKRERLPGSNKYWTLTFEDDKMATMYLLKWS